MSKINKVVFPEYTLDMIENIMSLRKPQKQSVKNSQKHFGRYKFVERS